MKFLIQNNLMGKKQIDMVVNAVKDFPHQYIGLMPFSSEIICEEPLEGIDYIPYGSTLLTTLGYEKYKWSGLYFDLDNFSYRKALKYRSDMLNNGFVIPIEDAITFLSGRPNDENWFVRPNLDLKQFSGIVLPAGECVSWFKDAMECDSSGSYKIHEGTMIVVAEPQVIQAEWRWFVVGGKVVSGSMYRCHQQPRQERSLEEDIIFEAQEKADEWLPHPCCVMDLALVNNKLKVIEFNSINSSGFYDHDVVKIFKELYNYSVSHLH